MWRPRRRRGRKFAIPSRSGRWGQASLPSCVVRKDVGTTTPQLRSEAIGLGFGFPDHTAQRDASPHLGTWVYGTIRTIGENSGFNAGGVLIRTYPVGSTNRQGTFKKVVAGLSPGHESGTCEFLGTKVGRDDCPQSSASVQGCEAERAVTRVSPHRATTPADADADALVEPAAGCGDPGVTFRIGFADEWGQSSLPTLKLPETEVGLFSKRFARTDCLLITFL